MDETIISIIVPVYNAEAFLDRCVNSVLAQSYTHWELLLIDDGSSDRSPFMCDSWAAKDERIKVFHKKNGGASSARNVGLKNMTGKYVTFLDADDRFMPDCLETCLRESDCNRLDVLWFSNFLLFPDGRTEHHAGKESPVCTPATYMARGGWFGCVWGGYYSTSIISKNDIAFNEKLHYLEDAFFICSILKHCKRIKRIANDFYEYYKNPNGSDKPKDWDYYLDSIEFGAAYKRENPEFAILIDGWCTMLAMRYITLAPKHDFPRFSKAWRTLSVEAEYLANAGRRDVVMFDKLQKKVGVCIASWITKAICLIFHKIK